MSLPDPGFTRREEVACELEENGWHNVAEDVRDGLPYEVILGRLREIGEEDSDAYEIVSLADG